MADLPQYTGVTYDAEMYKKPDESMADYMVRLAKLRATGVLGGGAMFDTPTAADTVVDPVAEQITSAPLGQVVTNSSSDATTGSGWDRMKTLEQKTAESLARQAELYAPKDVSSVFGLLPISGAGLIGLAAEGISQYQDTNTNKDYLDSVGFTDQYGKEGRDAMAKNPLAMMHLMSQNELPAVGGFERFDIGKYQPATWADMGKNLLNSVTGGLLGSAFNQAGMADPTPYASTDASIRSTVGMFDTINGNQVNTLEDVLNQTTVGNMFAGYGNYNPNANNGQGGYTIGTAANRNADGSYTIGTAANRNADGSYTIGTSSGESPIAATNNSKDSDTVNSSDMGWGLDTGGYSWW